MSSDTLARVFALYTKADELAERGHLLRAAENFGRAAEAARALGADNLVALQMELLHGNMLTVYVYVASKLGATCLEESTPLTPVPRPGILAAHRAECIALFAGAVEALERRRMAGTLEEGKCAAEETWRDSQLQHHHNFPATEAASCAALYGYDLYLRAATNLLDVLKRAHQYAAECSNVQFQSFTQFVVHAAELMQQPRGRGDTTMRCEAEFTAELRYIVAQVGDFGLDARLVQLLADALQRLQRSGMLQARHIEELNQSNEPEGKAFIAAVETSLTAPGLRRCALPGCGAREAHPTHFKSCAACRTVVYCCREHQVAGWPGHKNECKAARKAAAATDNEAGGSSGA